MTATAISMLDADTWTSDWLWSLPLILVTLIVHIFGLVFINDAVVAVLSRQKRSGRFMYSFGFVMASALLLIVVLHALEASIWALAYLKLGAMPHIKAAMLYSLGAMTSYGHANIFLAGHWQMMGVLQSLNGVLLFGLSTAFMFAMIQTVWQRRQSEMPPMT